MTRDSSIDWERDVYAHGRQLNRWPFSDLVSAVMRHTASETRERTRVLEIGSGAGNNLLFLASEGFLTSGIDGSSTAVQFAEARLRASGLTADVRTGDITALPFDNESFDLVLDRGAVTQNDYVTVAKILAEVRRVLSPGGTFMLFDLLGMDDPDRQYGTEVSRNCYDHFRSGAYQSVGLTAFFTFESLSELFTDFSSVAIARSLRLDSGQRVIGDAYDVVARKQALKIDAR